MLSSGSESSFGSDENPKPSAQAVDDFHENSDADSRAESLHHTLGPNPNQSSPGNHTHDGGASAFILTEETISGVRGDDTWALSVNAILVRLGAIDNSTAP